MIREAYIADRSLKKSFKKLLTNRNTYDNISELLLKNNNEAQRTLKTEQYVKP